MRIWLAHEVKAYRLVHVDILNEGSKSYEEILTVTLYRNIYLIDGDKELKNRFKREFPEVSLDQWVAPLYPGDTIIVPNPTHGTSYDWVLYRAIKKVTTTAA